MPGGLRRLRNRNRETGRRLDSITYEWLVGEEISMPSRQPSPGEILGQRIQSVARLWRKAADQRLDDFGLSHATARPLLALWRLGGEARQGAVAVHAGLEGPSVVRLIDLLLAEGLVTRAEDFTDRRAKILELTQKGETRIVEIMRVLDVLRDELLGDVKEEEIEKAVSVLTDLEKRLGRICSEI